MRKISILFLSSLVITSLFFGSCKKEETKDDNTSGNNTNPPTRTSNYVKEIKNNGYLDITLEYSNALLTKLTYYDTTGATDGYSTIEYNNNLTSLFKNYNVDNNLRYKYETVISGDKIVKIKKYWMDNDTLMYYSFDTIYYLNNKLVKVESYNATDRTNQSYKTYAWTGNNITEVGSYYKEYQTNVFLLETTRTYTYDTKKNPLNNIGIGVVFNSPDLLSENNVTKETSVNRGTTTIENSVIEYNSNSYPTKITKTNETTNESETSEYIY